MSKDSSPDEPSDLAAVSQDDGCQRILHRMSHQIWLRSPRKMAYPMRMACQRILHRMSRQIWLQLTPRKMAYPMRSQRRCQRNRQILTMVQGLQRQQWPKKSRRKQSFLRCDAQTFMTKVKEDA